ncbi:hypothetical protein [Nostoc sp. NMS8]|nr:hypothetical protein [Nostoc sp. NMS8]
MAHSTEAIAFPPISQKSDRSKHYFTLIHQKHCITTSQHAAR